MVFDLEVTYWFLVIVNVDKHTDVNINPINIEKKVCKSIKSVLFPA